MYDLHYRSSIKEDLKNEVDNKTDLIEYQAGWIYSRKVKLLKNYLMSTNELPLHIQKSLFHNKSSFSGRTFWYKSIHFAPELELPSISSASSRRVKILA